MASSSNTELKLHIVMLHGHPIMMAIATQAEYSKWANLTSGKERIGSPSSTDAKIIATPDAIKNLKWLDNLLIEIGLSTTIRHLYQFECIKSNHETNKDQTTKALTEQDKFSTAISC